VRVSSTSTIITIIHTNYKGHTPYTLRTKLFPFYRTPPKGGFKASAPSSSISATEKIS
jgi:hypothetical protein